MTLNRNWSNVRHIYAIVSKSQIPVSFALRTDAFGDRAILLKKLHQFAAHDLDHCKVKGCFPHIYVNPIKSEPRALYVSPSVCSTFNHFRVTGYLYTKTHNNAKMTLTTTVSKGTFYMCH